MRYLSVIGVALVAGLLISCASEDVPALGDRINVSPGWQKFSQRLNNVVRRPQFWAPLAGALAVQIDDQDERLTERLREDTPIFGSTSDASQASDDLRDLTRLGYMTTALVAPVNRETNWGETKLKLLLTEWAGVEATGVLTGWIKEASDRERPDGRDRRSFPSGHTSKATAQARFAILNSEYLPISETTETAMNAGFNGLAIGTAWARIEAGRHHPSDVLAGWSLGYLVSEVARVFIDDGGPPAQISVQLLDSEWQFSYRVNF